MGVEEDILKDDRIGVPLAELGRKEFQKDRGGNEQGQSRSCSVFLASIDVFPFSARPTDFEESG